jgi:cytochrome c oxidase subunit 1
MTTFAAPSASALHPRAAAFTEEARSVERRLGVIFATTGITLILLMGVLGLIMRLTQGSVIDLSPAWFYRLMTLHGMGMITGALIGAMGALWYVLHESVPLRVSHMVTGYLLTVVGALCVLVATLVGGFGAGWTFLPPLPFFAAGQWPVW